MAKQDNLGAFVIFIKALGPAYNKWMPAWYLKFILRLVFHGDRWSKMERQLSANLNEHKEVRRLDSAFNNYKIIQAKVLLMAGKKSSLWAQKTIQTLHDTISQSSTLILPSLDHFAPENGHAPVAVARQLKQFFVN